MKPLNDDAARVYRNQLREVKTKMGAGQRLFLKLCAVPVANTQVGDVLHACKAAANLFDQVATLVAHTKPLLPKVEA